MADKFAEASAHELEIRLETLFKRPRMVSSTLAEIPIVGGRYIVALDHSVPLLRVCRALCSGVLFSHDVPGWPPLPLHEDAIEAMKNADNNRANILAFYADSLAAEGWDYEGHPRFAAFCAGLLAYEHTPIEVRSDRELQLDFPPRPLDGLCDGQLHWRSPETLAQDRDMLARCAAYEAALAQERMGA